MFLKKEKRAVAMSVFISVSQSSLKMLSAPEDFSHILRYKTLLYFRSLYKEDGRWRSGGWAGKKRGEGSTAKKNHCIQRQSLVQSTLAYLVDAGSVN